MSMNFTARQSAHLVGGLIFGVLAFLEPDPLLAQQTSHVQAVGQIDWSGPAVESFVSKGVAADRTLAMVCNLELDQKANLYEAPGNSSTIVKQVGRNAIVEVEFSLDNILWAKVLRGERNYDESGYATTEVSELQGVSSTWIDVFYLCDWEEPS